MNAPIYKTKAFSKADRKALREAVKERRELKRQITELKQELEEEKINHHQYKYLYENKVRGTKMVDNFLDGLFFELGMINSVNHFRPDERYRRQWLDFSTNERVTALVNKIKEVKNKHENEIRSVEQRNQELEERHEVLKRQIEVLSQGIRIVGQRSKSEECQRLVQTFLRRFRDVEDDTVIVDGQCVTGSTLTVEESILDILTENWESEDGSQGARVCPIRHTKTDGRG